MSQLDRSNKHSGIALARAQQASGGSWSYSAQGYALRQSLRQLGARKFSSISTLTVLSITLALPVLFFFIAESLDRLSTNSLKDESITLYLSLDISDLQGADLATTLQNEPDIASTQYISRDEALSLLTENTDVAEAMTLLEDNPLPGAVVVFPKAEALQPKSLEAITQRLEGMPEVQRVQLDLVWVKRLQAVLSLVRLIGWLLAGFLTLTALLVIGNTIRLELLRRRPEIEVSRLLGASRGFIHRPILISGALYGFLAGTVACVTAALALVWIRRPTQELSALYASSFTLPMPTASQFLIVILLATALGLLGALITLYRPSHQTFQTGK